jgi:hypothetical protein
VQEDLKLGIKVIHLMKKSMRALIADDKLSARQGLKALLTMMPRVETDFITGYIPANNHINLTEPMKTVQENTWNRLPDFVAHGETECEDFQMEPFDKTQTEIQEDSHGSWANCN